MDLIVPVGSLLAASPDLRDRNFMHSVVLVVAHGEGGAHGLVINRPANLSIDALLPQHPLLGRAKFPVHAGGPVGLDTLQILHRVPEHVPEGIELGDGVAIGGELDAVARYVAEHPRQAQHDVRFVLGYAGWSAGQLERELADSSWLPAQLRADWIFGNDAGSLWRRVVRSLGDDAAGLDVLPPDPTWN